jgi:uncharacterized membrane protein YphA (DoxX/SURF4 family)
MTLGHGFIAALGVSGRVCVGLVFVVAGLQNMVHWRVLAGVVGNYRLLPSFLVLPVSLVLPPLETVLGFLLVCGVGGPWPALAGMVLLGVFAMAMLININRGRTHIDCGCGDGFLKQPLRLSLVGRNGVLGLMLIVSFLASSPVGGSLALSGAAAGVGFFLLYLVLNVLAGLPPARAHNASFA